MTFAETVFQSVVSQALKPVPTAPMRPRSYAPSSVYGKLEGIEELEGVGVLYKYPDNYVLDFSKLQSKGLAGFNLFGFTIPSLILPTPNQVFNAASSIYRNVRNTAASVRNAIIVTARSGINRAAQISRSGVQSLYNLARNSHTAFSSTVNAYRREITNRLNSFNKTVVRPAFNIINRLPRAAASRASRVINRVWGNSNRVARNLISKATTVMGKLDAQMNRIGKKVVNVATPFIRAVESGMSGITSGMIRQYKTAVSNLNKIQVLLIKLSASKDPKTQKFVRNFNALYGSTLSKAKKNFPIAKKEAAKHSSLGIVITGTMAIVAIIGLSAIIFKALDALQTYMAGNSVKAEAELVTAKANEQDSETKGKAMEDGGEYLRITNEEYRNIATAFDAMQTNLADKQEEITLGKAEREEIINHIVSKEAELAGLKEQMANMVSAGISEDDPAFIAIANALNSVNADLEVLNQRQQSVDGELAADQNAYNILLEELEKTKLAVEEARQNAYAANQEYNNLVGAAGLPPTGYGYPEVPAAADGGIFASIAQALTNPFVLLGGGALAVVLWKK